MHSDSTHSKHERAFILRTTKDPTQNKSTAYFPIIFLGCERIRSFFGFNGATQDVPLLGKATFRDQIALAASYWTLIRILATQSSYIIIVSCFLRANPCSSYPPRPSPHHTAKNSGQGR